MVIGVSAGGPKELQRILPLFPTGFAPPIVVVQHIAREVLDSLVYTLKKACYLPVRTIAQGQLLDNGGIFLCPPLHQCRIFNENGVLAARLEPDRTSAYQPCIDVTMESAAEACGRETVGVLLTGMGSDGVKGLKSIQKAGGLTIVESQATAAVFGMPKAAVSAGAAQRILPLHQIPTELLMLVRQKKTELCPAPDEALKSEDPTDRCHAIERLAACPDSESVKRIAEVLHDPEAIVMETARAALLSLPGVLVFPAVTPLLESDSPSVRTTAMEIAKRTGLPPEGVDILRRLAAGDDPDLRLFALEIIGSYGTEDLLDAVLERLSDSNRNVALKAVEALGGFHSERALDALSEELAGDSWRRAAAIEALVHSPLDRSGSILVDLRLDAFEDLSIWFQALAARRDRRAVRKLLAVLPGIDQRLTARALTALAETCLAHRADLSPNEIEAAAELPLAMYLDQDDERIRAAAIELIGIVGGEKQLSLLRKRFKQAGPAERDLIARAVESIRPENPDEILNFQLDDQDSLCDFIFNGGD